MKPGDFLVNNDCGESNRNFCPLGIYGVEGHRHTHEAKLYYFVFKDIYYACMLEIVCGVHAHVE